MEIFKKVAVVVIEILLVLGFCFAVLCFLFPDIFGIKKEEPEVAEANTEHTTWVTTTEEVITEEVTEEETEEVTEATTEEVTEATTEKKTEEKTEATTQKKNNSEDTEDPIFLIFRSSPTIEVGDTFDIHEFIGYGDNIDRDVDLNVIGTVDESHVGTYALTVTIQDDAGNKSSRNMTVEVVEPSSGGGDYSGGGYSSGGEDFSDFISAYKTPQTSVGIDISRFQESVDFEAVKEAGCEFVIMRIGGFDRGTYYTDKYYHENIVGAKAAGLKVGVYWHAEDGSVQDVENSVRYLMDILEDEQLDFPIAYDWEDFESFEKYGMNLHDLNVCFEAFANGVEARGYEACLYSSLNFLENTWENEEHHQIWLAHYTSATSYTGDYFMWQHSNTGRINGVNGDVDLNVLYK